MTRHGTFALALGLAIAGCDLPEVAPRPTSECAAAEYPDWETSAYVLPYPAGSEYYVLQGNCGAFSHTEGSNLVFSYDFELPMGDPVVASRAGRVVETEASYSDTDHERGHENGVAVAHADGTWAYYIHFTQDGVAVDVGEEVAAGDTLGYSGNSGFSTQPHLHFAVYSGCAEGACQPLPVTFRNTLANPKGPAQGRVYRAEPYGRAAS